MKNNITAIIIAVLVTLLLTGFGTRSYYKESQDQLVAVYDSQLVQNAVAMTAIQKENVALKAQIASDAKFIAQRDVELAKLKTQAKVLQSELIIVKAQIKDFTAGEAIRYFETYTQTVDGKMLVQDADTSLIVTTPTLKKVDDIFAEHNNFKLSVVNLNSTIDKQTGIIIIQNNSLSLYKKTLENKNQELTLQKDSYKVEKATMQLNLNKYRVQRNRAYGIIAGTVGIVTGYFILKK